MNTRAKSPSSGLSYADKRRDEKKQALREYLQGQKYVEAIHKDLEREIADAELPVVKFKTETRLKLLNKVLPDVARTELTGEDGNPIQVQDVPLIVRGVAPKRD
jgi:hypothetical protein